MARFGYLYLNDGCWENERLLPEDWVTQSTSLSPVMSLNASMQTPIGFRDGTGGSTLRILKKVSKRLGQIYPLMLGASGHWGQSITVIPDQNMVVVRTADDRDGSFVKNDFLKLAIAVGANL